MSTIEKRQEKKSFKVATNYLSTLQKIINLLPNLSVGNKKIQN